MLIVSLGRDPWDAILYGFTYIGLEKQIGKLLFNCTSSGFPTAAVYATWHVSNSRCCWSVQNNTRCSLVHFTCLIMLSEFGDTVAMKVRCRMLRLSGLSSSDLVTTRDVPRPLQLLSCNLVYPVDCWFIIALIIFYIFTQCLILASLSLKYLSLISVCACVICLIVTFMNIYIYHDNIITLNLYSIKYYWYT